MSTRKLHAVISLVIAALVAPIATDMLPRLWNMKSEYVTADVIRSVQSYVVKNKGAWPRSWADLGEDHSRYTRVNFSVDPIAASQAEVESAIAPVSGRYQTYPHAASDLKRLYSELQRCREGQPEPGVGADSR